MFSGLKPYAEYKGSGVPWLGRVPTGWPVKRVKALLGERSSKGFPTEPLLAATQSAGVVRKQDYESRTVTAQKDLHLLKLVEAGDFVISLRSFQGGIERAHHRGIISPAYTVLYPRDWRDRDYLSLLFKSRGFIDGLTLCVTGIREGQNIDYQLLSRDRLPAPKKEEQETIAKFLGHAKARIDRSIAAKRKMIELLDEQKRAAVNLAVIRSMATDGSLKESDVSGVRFMPANWQVLRLKSLAAVQTGLTLGKDYGESDLEEFPYLRVANVQSWGLDLTEVKSVRVPAVDAARVRLQNGDVLMTEGGDIDKLGRATIWQGDVDGCLHQNHVFVVRCGERIEPDYLVTVLGSALGRDYFQLTAKQTTNLASTNSTTLRAFPLPLPPIEEQRHILSQLREEHALWLATAQRLRREIELLREFRTRLTADVVTGQLDVREAAAKLPDLDPAELATIDVDDSDNIDAVAEEFLDEDMP